MENDRYTIAIDIALFVIAVATSFALLLVTCNGASC